jgi:DNA-binding CsgD family transcriptional regulator
VEARSTGVGGLGRNLGLDDLPTRGSHEPLRTAGLTARERAVLTRLAEGRPTEEVAELLHVSPHTVRSRLKTILRKLSARNREHAVAIAVREGAIDPEL